MLKHILFQNVDWPSESILSNMVLNNATNVWIFNVIFIEVCASSAIFLLKLQCSILNENFISGLTQGLQNFQEIRNNYQPIKRSFSQNSFMQLIFRVDTSSTGSCPMKSHQWRCSQSKEWWLMWVPHSSSLKAEYKSDCWLVEYHLYFIYTG